MAKTIAEINEKIKQGNAVIVTAEEMINIVRDKGPKKASQDIDVVTTGTFGPMCSSGMYLNVGHTKPRMKFGGGTSYLNNVPVYTGLAAVDMYLGATALPEDDPKNTVYPGEFKYGGGHIINEFVAGKDIRLIASGYGTDCYPRKKLDTWINIKDVNEAVLSNFRNCYQNYNVAVNLSEKTIYTYMGILKPHIGNANYCSAGQLSPLLNDPYYRTIGLGTRIFLGGGIGYVTWNGTQHNPSVPRNEKGVPKGGSGTIAVTGDLKQMNPEWLQGASYTGYGSTLIVGIGIPIPVLDEDMAVFTSISDEDIVTQIVDYSKMYPEMEKGSLGEISYAELKSGTIKIKGKDVPTASLSSYSKAKEIAETLKQWIEEKKFFLTECVMPLPGPESGIICKTLKERPVK
jgi:uncharacterized protein (DUF39 family)